jgi:hypothetical protein
MPNICAPHSTQSDDFQVLQDILRTTRFMQVNGVKVSEASPALLVSKQLELVRVSILVPRADATDTGPRKHTWQLDQLIFQLMNNIVGWYTRSCSNRSAAL